MSTGCIDPESLTSVEKRRKNINDMINMILLMPGIVGIKYTGGEPMV
jgi:hypothetical protein